MMTAGTRRLTHGDHDRILRALERLYAQTDVATLRECMVRLASGLIGADFGSYSEFSKAESKMFSSLRFPDVSHVVDRHVPAFLAHFHEHPVLHFTLRTGRVDAQRSSEVMTSWEFHRTHLYNEYFRPIQIRWQLIFSIDRPGWNSVAITLNRNGRDFSSRDVAVFESLRPHYGRALENVTRLAGLAAGASAMDGLQRARGEATLVVDRDGRVQWMSLLAGEWLSAACGVATGVGLPAPEQISRWLRTQRRAQALMVGPFAPLRIACRGGSLVVRWVTRDEEGNNSVILSRELPGPDTSAHLPELTARENEILGWIAQGKTNPEIATIAGLSVRTVYKHLENIYRKINVENRACAMLRVLEGHR